MFAVLGVVVSLLLTPEYVADAQLMPEMTSSSGDVLRRLATMASVSGIDLAETEGVEAIRPDLYPSVLQSKPYRLYLINQTVPTATGRTTVGELVLPTTTWLTRLTKLAGLSTPAPRPAQTAPNTPLRLSTRQKNLLDAIGERVTARFDTRSGIIFISARMPDAVSAAAVAEVTMHYLTRYVTDYRTEKTRQDLHFYTRRLADAKSRYQAAQIRLFRYNDQHKSLILQAATMERQQLADELTIAQSVYAELTRQHEQARLKVQQQTPVFKTLEPPTVPPERASPRRSLIVLASMAAGLIMGIGWAGLGATNWTERWQTLMAERN